MITLVFLHLFIMYFYALVLTCIHTLNTSTRYFSHPCAMMLRVVSRDSLIRSVVPFGTHRYMRSTINHP